MAAVRVLGNDVTMGVAGGGGFLELNVYKPVLIATYLESAALLADGCEHVRRFAVEGIEADVERIGELVSRSLMLATALAPQIGYDQAAALAHRAHESGRTLREVALESGIRREDFDRWTNPQKLAGL
jgi:fumarate hydratase class II